MGTSVRELMREFYADTDKRLAEALVGRQVSCQRGCAHCCHLRTAICTADAICLAENVLTRQDWKQWIPKLAEAAQGHCFEGISDRTYFDKRIPCPFLDAQNDCVVYADRPACCRFHLVVSDPEWCRPEHRDHKVGTIDLRVAESAVWERSMKVEEELFGGPRRVPIIGPLPIMVVFAMRLMIPASEPEADYLRQETSAVLEPAEYFKRYTIQDIMGRAHSRKEGA